MILDMCSSHRSLDPAGSLTYPRAYRLYFERLYVDTLIKIQSHVVFIMQDCKLMARSLFSVA